MKQSLYDLADIWLGVMPASEDDRFIEVNNDNVEYPVLKKSKHSALYWEIKAEREKIKEGDIKIENEKINWKKARKVNMDIYNLSFGE